MSPPKPITAADFDISKVKFGTAKNLDNGGKIIPISYNDGQFIVQTPKLSCPYGVSVWENSDKHSVEVSFGKHEENSDLGAFFSMAQELNKLILNEALDKSNAWFKKKHTQIEVIEALYTSLIKYSKDKTTGEISHAYPPTFKIGLPKSPDGNWRFQAYSAERELVDFGAINLKGGEMIALIQCTGVWVAGGKCGCTWNAVQVKVFPNGKSLPPFAFLPDPEEDYADFVPA